MGEDKLRKQEWVSGDDGYTFAGVNHEEEMAVHNFDDLVKYMDEVVAEGKSNPARVIGKLASLIYQLAGKYFDEIADLEYKLDKLQKAYERHEHVNAVVVKD